MANKHRGEIEAEIEGSARTLCLTLGALAELEEALGGEDVFALMKRFGEGAYPRAGCRLHRGGGAAGRGRNAP